MLKGSLAVRTCLKDMGGRTNCIVPVYFVQDHSRSRVWCKEEGLTGAVCSSVKSCSTILTVRISKRKSYLGV